VRYFGRNVSTYDPIKDEGKAAVNCRFCIRGVRIEEASIWLPVVHNNMTLFIWNIKTIIAKKDFTKLEILKEIGKNQNNL